ncbi:MAG: N-acetyl-alpha-D-glucosaminyl L-malate synthase BshA [Gemmatimonadaceae bacterium]|nr:N-acetyl-alpha-D-glucosaminyl L-malate synthase BshA [Gemmatimonadaceae bacterium]MCW5825036.1 N-acetyl-alpha-D-glucosaminyl L-malate synthase BshA [Gemmatimonadaceae bacterium]
MKLGITCYPTYGGSGAVATELGIALAARGHEVHFITYEHPFRLPHFLPRVSFHEVNIGNYPLFEYPPYDLALAVRMHDVALSQGLDLLHVHYAIPHATSAWIAKEMLATQGRRLPVVTTLHGTDITIVGQDHSYHAITRFSIERSDRITSVSRWLKDETVKAFGCENCRVDVVPNFVDPVEFDRARHGDGLRAELGRGTPVLMHISNFRPVKRVRDVVRIFAKVLAQRPCTLVMVGDGPDRGAAEDEARTLGVADKVRFLGRIDDVAPLLAAADLYLFPSETESFGLSALEALASGVPVVGSNVGGVSEVVRDGVTGALLPLGDVEGMASAALALLEPTRWAAASAAAAADARARFSTAQIVAQYEAIYADALAALR